MKRIAINLALLLTAVMTSAQPRFSEPHGLYNTSSLTIGISSDQGAEIRYTLDGSTPTASSQRYTGPLTLNKTTIVRAVEVKDSMLSAVATASYIFTASVLAQPNNPAGYPAQWGRYTEISGRATADYEMDPEMTNDATLRPKIIEGLGSLPILSIVTDKDNLFSHENDSVRGGIYIFTGPPVGDRTGHGWTRPASVELMGGPEQHDLSTTCGLRLHGGHGRLAEKNPKHSFRLVFKKEYGAKTLKYPVFGDDCPAQFDQLVARCHFGNSWQHWSSDNRQKAQYTRDVWARRMQRKMGHTSVNALYVHLFLNGMYWGMYNIAERVDDQFGKNHLGGSKSDIDVVKIEEDGGNHIEASEGDLKAWNLMVQTTRNAADDDCYQQLDTLLDIDNFIDYMLINQYGGNTDWDHHNWYAIRRRGSDSKGFRFLCWDSEIIFENAQENVLKKNNGNSFPTGIFNNLLRNEQFARRYLKRAKELLADDGLLGQQSVVAVWDSLHNTVCKALYAEAARWGDYRRDVHQYTSRGSLYTVDNHYMAERQRLLSNYFPVRSANVLNSIVNFVDIDDFEAPADWIEMTPQMFCEWSGSGANAQPLDKSAGADWNLGTSQGGGTAIAGFVAVGSNQYADISQYDKLILRGSGSGLRILANRLADHGPWKQIVVSFNQNDPYWDSRYEVIAIPLDNLRTMPNTNNEQSIQDFVHLNAIKVDWNSNITVRAIYLVPKTNDTDINGMMADRRAGGNGIYNLNGQRVGKVQKGLYIKNGKKVIVN